MWHRGGSKATDREFVPRGNREERPGVGKEIVLSRAHRVGVRRGSGELGEGAGVLEELEERQRPLACSNNDVLIHILAGFAEDETVGRVSRAVS